MNSFRGAEAPHRPNVPQCNMGPPNSCEVAAAGVVSSRTRAFCPVEEPVMAKGQKSNKEIRKPKKEQPKKANASNPSVKPGVVRGLDNMSNDR